MRHLATLVLLSASLASAQTAAWPGSIVTDSELLVAANLCTARLTTAVPDTTSTTFNVTNTSVTSTCFVPNMELQIDNEFVFVVAVPSPGRLTVTRAFDHSIASPHLINTPINNVPAAWYHNSMRVEIEAMEAWMFSLINQPGAGDSASQLSPRMNVGAGGVTQYMIIKQDSGGSAIMGTGGYGGIAQATAPAGSTVRVAMGGVSPCIFDGPAVIGNQVIASQTVPGDCHDYGLTTTQLVPATTPSIGVVMAAATGPGAQGTVKLHGMGVHGGGYSNGQTNGGNMSMTDKASEYAAFDDFNDGSYLPGHNCSPSSSTAVNNIACANAINWASPKGIVLSCQGTYQTSVALPIINQTAIDGHGPLGCTFKQTNAAADVFDVFRGPSLVANFVKLSNFTISGGVNGIGLIGSDQATDRSLANKWDLNSVRFDSQTHANIFVNPFGAIQYMRTQNTFWWCLSTCTNVLMTAQAALNQTSGYIGGWHSVDDQFSGSYRAIDTDASSPTGGGYYFDNVRFQGYLDRIIQIKGPQNFIVFNNGISAENIGRGDNGGRFQTITSGTTSGINSTLLTVASSTGLAVNDVLTIEKGAADGTDVQTTIQSIAGNALTVNPAIPASLNTPVEVTNATMDAITFATGVLPYCPGQVAFNSGGTPQGAPFASSVRYGVYNACGGFNHSYNNFVVGRPVYDPGGRLLTGMSSGTVNGGSDGFRFRSSDQVAVSAYNRMSDGSVNHPAQYVANPGNGGGFQVVMCGDGSFNQNAQCGFTGNYGPFQVTPYANSTVRLPWFFIDPSTNAYITPGAIATNSGNLNVGPPFGWNTKTGSNQMGAKGSILLGNEALPVGPCVAGVGAITLHLGHPWFTDPSCVQTDLLGGAPSVPVSASPPASTTGSIGVNTSQGALQISVNGTPAQSVPTVPSIAVPLSDVACASGSDTTIGARAVTAATSATNAVITVSGTTNGWAALPGTSITLSGFGDTGWNGVYTASAISSTTFTLSLNSTSLTFTPGSGTPTISLTCANSSDGTGGGVNFQTTYTAPANSFVAPGKQLSLDTNFEMWSSPTQTGNLITFGMSDTVSGLWNTTAAAVTGGISGGVIFAGNVDITAGTTPGNPVPLIIGGRGFAIPGYPQTGLIVNASYAPARNTTGAMTFKFNARWIAATGAGGTITAAQGTGSTVGAAGTYCLATATGTQLSGTGAVWLFVLTGANTIAGTQTFSKLPQANTGSGYTGVPTTTWTLSNPVANPASGIVPAVCSGVATATGGTLVGAMGNAFQQLTQRRVWWY